MKELYTPPLANEWIDWVESSNPFGSRELDILPFIQKWIRELHPSSIADLGCGQGSCSQFIDAHVQYTGVDSSPTLISRAKELYCSPNKTFVSGDVCAIPLDDNAVEAVMSIWVWSHVGDLLLAAKEMYRILKSNGHFLIITANPKTYNERMTFYTEYSIQGNLLIGSFDVGTGKKLTNTTLYLHSQNEMEGALKKAGFTISSVKGMGQAASSEDGLYVVIEGMKGL